MLRRLVLRRSTRTMESDRKKKEAELCKAARSGDLETVRRLLSEGVSVCATDWVSTEYLDSTC